MFKLGAIVAPITTDLSGFQRGLAQAGSFVDGFSKDVSSKMQKLQKTITDTGENLKNAGQKMSIGLTAPITLGFGLALRESVKLNEAINANEVIFGNASLKLQEFAKTSAKTVGLSKSDFLQFGVVLGAMFQNLGFSQDESAERTIEMTKRAVDMASVFNTTVPEALQAMQAGLRGEIDPLEKFGVGLSATAVQAHALETGIIDVDRELTDSEKGQARYSLMMEQTNKTSGDFKNTSDEVANAQRILTAETADLAAEFGEELQPIMKQVLAITLSVLKAFNGLTEGQKRTILIILAVVAVLGPLLVIFGTLLKVLAVGIGLFAKLKTGLVVAKIAFFGITAPMFAVIAAVVAVIAILVLLVRNWATVSVKTRQALDYISRKTSQVFGFMRGVIGGFVGFIGGIAGRAFEPLRGALNGILGFFRSINWFSIGLGIVNGIAGAITAGAGRIGGAIRGAIGNAVPDFLKGKIPGFASGVSSFAGGLAQINERGGEIVGLPNGTTVIPASLSSEMLSGLTPSTAGVSIGNIYISKEVDADRFLRLLDRKTRNEKLIG